MPIPDQSTIDKHRQEVRDGLKKRGIVLPDDWVIDIDVRPWLGFDIEYELGTETDPNAKRIAFTVYSARYPRTWRNWIEEALDEIAEGITKKILAGELPNILADDVKTLVQAVLDLSRKTAQAHADSQESDK